MSNGFNTPQEIAQSLVTVGKKKCSLSFISIVLLGILAGAYIGFGAELMTMVTHDLAKYVGMGFARFLGGAVFSVGLMLVVIGGAELFTGNNLILTGVIKGEVSWLDMLKNWVVVYLANFIGSLLLVYIMFYSGLWAINQLGVGASALSIATAKVNITWVEAFARGIGCNWLVCLAIWLALASKDVVGKIFAIFFPIMAFVASGFEHSVANMYFIPMGLLLKSNAAVVAASGLAGEKLANLTWSGFVYNNLIPVTLGNIVGGAVFVGAIYAFAYLRETACETK
ncbi:MAG: formate/nitrite transporter family protein [Candidatus Margulisbacteria bacterium]|nr:formate/nitrite transporter family protein [Candidatus Margulisiibacteriota bacterium]